MRAWCRLRMSSYRPLKEVARRFPCLYLPRRSMTYVYRSRAVDASWFGPEADGDRPYDVDSGPYCGDGENKSIREKR